MNWYIKRKGGDGQRRVGKNAKKVGVKKEHNNTSKTCTILRNYLFKKRVGV